MDLGLRGKVAVITGGSEGIGFATAHRLASEGVAVAISARRPDVLERARARIESETGGRVVAVAADMATPEGAERLFAAVDEQLGGVDILVNNVGRSARGHFLEITDEEWQADLDLKLFAAIRCSRLAARRMIARGGGRIVSVLSINGKQPGPASVPTSVVRAAGIALTKAMAHDLVAYRILVSAVLVGSIRSAQWPRLHAKEAPHLSLEEFIAQRVKAVPLRRIGEAEEVANVIAFLASEAASYVTGTVINVDGGVSAVV